MISRRDYMEIKAQYERGVYKTDIARSLGIDRKTVQRAERVNDNETLAFRV